MEKETIIVLGKDIFDDESLIYAIATSLQFPSYFGYNWDALFDCIKESEEYVKTKKIKFQFHIDSDQKRKDLAKKFADMLIEATEYSQVEFTLELIKTENEL